MFYDAERFVAHRLIHMSGIVFDTDIERIDRLIDKAQMRDNIELTENQRDAVREMCIRDRSRSRRYTACPVGLFSGNKGRRPRRLSPCGFCAVVGSGTGRLDFAGF